MWTATYLPNCSRDKDGFATQDEAIQFVVDNCLCSMCQDEGWGSSCAAEWLVVKTSKLNDCENLGDVFEASGAVLMEKKNDIS